MDDDTISIQKKLIVIDKDAVSTQGYEIWTQGRKGRIEDFGNGGIMEYGRTHHHHHHAPHLHDPVWAQLGL